MKVQSVIVSNLSEPHLRKKEKLVSKKRTLHPWSIIISTIPSGENLGISHSPDRSRTETGASDEANHDLNPPSRYVRLSMPSDHQIFDIQVQIVSSITELEVHRKDKPSIVGPVLSAKTAIRHGKTQGNGATHPAPNRPHGIRRAE